ncbi:uncharacterized protein [Dysidea avara]|uniref:uncharacterized protein n=1 Tax=Dysidea avara TaxID=196820 RepID=UPI0033291643
MDKGVEAKSDRLTVGLETSFVDLLGSNVLQCKNQARPLCCITDEDADYYAVFIQTLVNPVVTNCNTVDTQLDSLIDYNATTESLHNLIMSQGLQQTAAAGFGLTCPKRVGPLENSVVKMNEEIKEMEGICKERRQSIALLKQTLAVLQENFIVLNYRTSPLNGEEQQCDSISDGLGDGKDEVFRASKPDVIEIDDSSDENSNNEEEISRLYPTGVPDSVQDDVHNNIPPLIHTNEYSDEVDKEKSHISVDTATAAAHQTFLDNMTWFPFLYYPIVDSDTDNCGVDSQDDSTHQMICQSRAANHHISVIKMAGIQQV